MSWPILSVVTFLPLVGALFILVHARRRRTASATRAGSRCGPRSSPSLVSLVLIWRFDPSSAEFQFVEKTRWLGGAINYHMGVDGISLPFVILTTRADAGLHPCELGVIQPR